MGGVTLFKGYRGLARFMAGLAPEEAPLVVHAINLFNPSLLAELLALVPRLKRLRPRVLYASEQVALPPFKWYRRVLGAWKPSSLASPLMEALLRARKGLVDGFIAVKRSTLRYLVGDLRVPPGRVLYVPWIGVDPELVDPAKLAGVDYEPPWERLSCDYRLALVSAVTMGHGGRAKGG